MADGERILLGRIVAAHGIRGDVLVRTYTDDRRGDRQLRPPRRRGRTAHVQAARPPRDDEGRRRALRRHQRPQRRRSPRRHRPLCRARAVARRRGGGILPCRPDRACRGRAATAPKSGASSAFIISAPAISSRSRSAGRGGPNSSRSRLNSSPRVDLARRIAVVELPIRRQTTKARSPPDGRLTSAQASIQLHTVS